MTALRICHASYRPSRRVIKTCINRCLLMLQELGSRLGFTEHVLYRTSQNHITRLTMLINLVYRNIKWINFDDEPGTKKIAKSSRL